MVQDKPLHTSWQRKMKERQERKLTKDFARHLVEERERRRQVRSQWAEHRSAVTDAGG
jgi:rRNA-processing protein CGR1